MSKTDDYMPWRDETVLDIIGDNLYHDGLLKNETTPEHPQGDVSPTRQNPADVSESGNSDTGQNLSIDTAVNSFYDAVFKHAFRLGQEFPKDKTLPHDPCNAGDKERAKRSLQTIVEAVIGLDEELVHKSIERNSQLMMGASINDGKTIRNALKAAQRQRASEYFKGES